MSREEPRLPEIHIPRWLKLAVALPAILLPLSILGFILRDRMAHDEARCPYARVKSERLASDIDVVEERRVCIEGVEDRRFSVRRQHVKHVLGNRRLPTQAFTAAGYTWSAELKGDQVFLHSVVPGHPDAEFREGTAEERGD